MVVGTLPEGLSLLDCLSHLTSRHHFLTMLYDSADSPNTDLSWGHIL